VYHVQDERATIELEIDQFCTSSVAEETHGVDDANVAPNR
jgi:hypothetical protein